MMRGLGRNAGDVLIATDHPDGVAIEIMGLQLEKGG
jgi:hypothetical protein